MELEKVVGRGLPPTRTVELELKFVPVTVSVSAALPAATVLVERSLAPGTGLFTVKVVTREGLPPGLATITKGVPATAIALAGTATCNCVAFLYAAETGVDLKVTIELGVNPVPVRMSVNAGPPAVALAGTNAPITGWVLVARMVRIKGGVVPPGLPLPTGSVTEIFKLP